MKANVNKWMKLLTVLVLVIILVTIVNSTYGAINQGYSNQPLADVNVDETMRKNPLITPIAQIIYFVGLIMERVLTAIFQMVTGTADFPWADKIVFNAVPMLDINFINPDTSSLLTGNIYNLISNIYATIFTLCTTFFSIAVMVMAIKLATTAIASEKAKYKQAVWDWVVGLVLLFTIHIAISFMFYLNESLVKMASDIAKKSLEQEGERAEVSMSENVKQLADIARSTPEREWVANVIEENPKVVQQWITLPADDASRGLQQGVMTKKRWWAMGADTLEDKKTILNKLGGVILAMETLDLNKLQEARKSVIAINNRIYIDKKVFDNAMTFGKYQWIVNDMGFKTKTKDGQSVVYSQAPKTSDFTKYTAAGGAAIYVGAATYSVIAAGGIAGAAGAATGLAGTLTAVATISGVTVVGAPVAVAAAVGAALVAGTTYLWDETITPTTSDLIPILDELIKLKVIYDSDGKSGGTVGVLISDLAGYFKYNTWVYTLNNKNIASIDKETDEDLKDATKGIIKMDKAIIQNALLYAIIVVQSLILFIAYIKRMFYVIILAIMAPVVVVFDFFNKALGK